MTRWSSSCVSVYNKQGLSVTFSCVADTAGVSRALLYRDPHLRHEIERLREPSPSKAPRLPAAQRATQGSLTRRVENLLNHVRELRDENRNRREQVAVLLGQQRTTHPGLAVVSDEANS